MPFNIIALIVIVAGLGVILFVVVRKFPQVANLETQDLPEEKTATRKKEILQEKYARALVKFGEKLYKLAQPAKKFWEFIQGEFRSIVAKTKIKVVKAKKANARWTSSRKKTIFSALVPNLPANLTEKEDVSPETADRVESVLSEADAFMSDGRFSDAEQKYLNAIKLDPRNISAYRGLGKVYMKIGSYKEAIETFKFLLKLTPKDDTLYVKLAKISELKGDYMAAKEYFRKAIAMNSTVPVRHFEMGHVLEKLGQTMPAGRHFARAVELEEDNPRYLDGLLNIYIILKDKKSAQDVYEKLRLVNPENKKLAEFKQRVEEINI